MTTDNDDNTIAIGDWTAIEPSLVTMETQHVSAEVDVDLGTQVIQDHELIGLSVGTSDESSNCIKLFSGLTPAQARQLALELQEAAAAAEAATDNESTPDSNAAESTIGRLRQLFA